MEEKIFNRKDRRQYFAKNGILKMKGKLGYKHWCSLVTDNITNGKRLHKEHLDIWETAVYEKLQERETKLTAYLNERGFDKVKIDQYLEKWYQTL